MSSAYTPRLIAFVEEVAQRLQIPLHKGVYVGISGPTYMTNQELRMLAKLGGDVVGMSTVPEVIAASHTGLEVIGISCITDMAIGGEVESICHEEVIAMANQAKPMFAQLIRAIVARWNSHENDRYTAKRSGMDYHLTKQEIEYIITGYTQGEIPDYQMSAWAMAVYFQGMSAEETAYLTHGHG